MIYQKSKDFEHWIEYKYTDNPLVLSFEEEANVFFKEFDEHLFEVCQSNSTLRYVLRVHLNPRLIKKENTSYSTILLGKECKWNFLYQLDLSQPGEYIKTLKMDRNDSTKKAISFLRDNGLSGYVYLSETWSRYKDDPASKAFQNWIESLGVDE